MKHVLKSDAVKQRLMEVGRECHNAVVAKIMEIQRNPGPGKVLILDEEVVRRKLTVSASYNSANDQALLTMAALANWSGLLPTVAEEEEAHTRLEELIQAVYPGGFTNTENLGFRVITLPRFDGAQIVYLPEEQEAIDSEFGRYVSRDE